MYDNGLLKGEEEYVITMYHRFSITNRLPKNVLKPSLTIFTTITSGLASQFASSRLLFLYANMDLITRQE